LIIINNKKKKMVNRNWLGMLVIVLVFGMAVVGCDDGNTGNGEPIAIEDFFGTWILSDTLIITFSETEIKKVL